MSLSIGRFRDSVSSAFLTLRCSFERSFCTFEGRMIRARARARLRAVQGCVSRHCGRDGFPTSISPCEISERIGCLSSELAVPLQVLMDERTVLCFNADKETLLDAMGGDCIRVMKQYPSFRETYWAQQLRLPRLREHRIRNLNRLPAGVNFEGLRFISARIPKR